MPSIGRRVGLRLLPALLTASGLALLASGLMSYTNAVDAPPSPRPLASYEPLPTFGGGIILPGGSDVVSPSYPPGRVATRIVVRR